MATSRIHDVVDYLRRTALLQDGAGLTDGQLLECFIQQGDEAALAVLVRRHGPLVWSICRRILDNHHDAEDAFQATFLVLVRRAASVVPREMVANWLYGVASQTARKAKATTAKRRARERQMEQLPEPAVPELDGGDDLHHRLHEALAGLPAKFRASILLCYLEGKTRTEAARHLGVPEGTLAAWLARGRVMLAKRLARQGLAMSAGVLSTALVQSAASAAVPVSLVSSTMEAAGFLGAKQASSEVISTRVVALMEGVMKEMLATKVKKITTVVLTVVTTIGLGSGGLAYRMQAAEREIPALSIQPNEQQPQAKNEVAPEQAVSAAARVDSDTELLVGSGKEGKKDIRVADFDALAIRLPIQVIVKQAKTFSVVITGDDNLLDVVKADKDGSTLQFSSARRSSWRASKPLKATITMPVLGRVHLDSASHLTISDFKSNTDCDIKTSGASHLDGSIEARNIKLDARGASHVKLKGSGKKTTLSASGGCHLQLGEFTVEDVKLDTSGGSTVKVKGSAKKANLSASGGCHLQLGDFALDEATVKLIGACSAVVNVTTKLDYSLAGASHLRYRGNPSIGQKHSTGASSVRRAKE